MPARVARFNYFLNAGLNFSQEFKNIYVLELGGGQSEYLPLLLTRVMVGMQKLLEVLFL
jgi:hypothetical protein